jgi:hypothetical protein
MAVSPIIPDVPTKPLWQCAPGLKLFRIRAMSPREAMRPLPDYRPGIPIVKHMTAKAVIAIKIALRVRSRGAREFIEGKLPKGLQIQASGSPARYCCWPVSIGLACIPAGLGFRALVFFLSQECRGGLRRSARHASRIH